MPSAIDQRLAAPFEREVQDREGEAEPGDLVPVARLDRPDRFPYVKNREGTDPVNLYGGIFRDASHLKPNPLMHYGMNYDLQEVDPDRPREQRGDDALRREGRERRRRRQIHRDHELGVAVDRHRLQERRLRHGDKPGRRETGTVSPL